MLSFLKQLVAREELEALERYRIACSQIERWNASIPDSADTARWIAAYGEGTGPLDSSEFRERLKNRGRAKKQRTSEDPIVLCQTRDSSNG